MEIKELGGMYLDKITIELIELIAKTNGAKYGYSRCPYCDNDVPNVSVTSWAAIVYCPYCRKPIVNQARTYFKQAPILGYERRIK